MIHELFEEKNQRRKRAVICTKQALSAAMSIPTNKE